MKYDPLEPWRLAWQAQEMMAAAALTIGLRTFAISQAMAGLRPHDHDENSRMLLEKWRAASESAFASAMLWPQLLAASPTSAWQVSLRMVSGGLKPYHTAVTANAKRLSASALPPVIRGR
jgi:hypothetical protein